MRGGRSVVVELDQGGRRAGRAGVQRVPAALADFAESTFVLDRQRSHDDVWRIVPDLSGHVLVHVESDRDGTERVRAVVVGARTRFVDAVVRDRRLTVGVRLAPGALEALTGVRGRDLADRGVALDELWPSDTARLLDRVSHERGSESARGELLALIRRRASGRRPPDWRVRGFVRQLRSGRNHSLDAIATALGVSHRTLRRTCRDTIGFGPKRMARIERLYRGISLSVSGRGREGSRLAAAAGYADQSHMIREFQALLGETPSAFMRRR